MLTGPPAGHSCAAALGPALAAQAACGHRLAELSLVPFSNALVMCVTAIPGMTVRIF